MTSYMLTLYLKWVTLRPYVLKAHGILWGRQWIFSWEVGKWGKGWEKLWDTPRLNSKMALEM